MSEKKQLVWFNEVDKEDIGLVGGKGANLGEIVNNGFPIPPGFIVTSEAYLSFLNENNLPGKIEQILKIIDVNKPDQLNIASQKIRNLILRGQISPPLATLITRSYEQLCQSPTKHILVAVRSSATAEDLPDASFAGQQESFLNVRGEANLVNKVRACWSSLFTPRAIFYRETKKFSHFKVAIAVVVQKMIQSDASGVIFTLDPVTNDKTKIICEAIYGLGDLIVQGRVNPDHYEIDKTTFKIIAKQISHQDIKQVKSGSENKIQKVSFLSRKKQKITDLQIIKLAKLAKKIHQHYFFPQDIEWAIENGQVYILQTRPVTTSKRLPTKEKAEVKKINLHLIIKGDPASPGVASGYSRVIKTAKTINLLEEGEVLVTSMTTPDFVTAMKKASAIITDHGGQTSHAAIVSRELGVPCVVGTQKGTKILKNGLVITVNGSTGEVFKGSMLTTAKGLMVNKSKMPVDIPGSIPFHGLKNQSQYKTATKLYVNLGEPDLADEMAKKDVDGVGLLRAEFMIAQSIKYHPKKLIEDKKEKVFIDLLSQGMEKFCRAFYPRPVVYRTTDFKTNEYANLIGGKYFEPAEQNPLLGFRGAFRYLNNEAIFELELKAIKIVRNKFGFKNLWLMIPFVRTPWELSKVKKIITANGLGRSPSFQLWMMVEIPSNVILLDDFIKVGIDGVSVGSNDLTMLTLGVDRDNEALKTAFDERDKAVLWSLEKVVKTCLKHKITCSICGQAPSIYPDLTQQLVQWGITSVSINPDMIDKTREIIYEAEKRRVR